MVKMRVQQVGKVVLLLGLICACAWVLIPSVVSCGPSAYASLIRNALAACRQEQGVFPQSFLEVEPFLELSTRTDCRITQNTQDTYRVEMPLSTSRVYDIEVTYRVDCDGLLEKYNVRVVSCKRGH